MADGPLDELIGLLARLPGLGPRSARRAALALATVAVLGLGLLTALGQSPVLPANLERAAERLASGLSARNLLELYRTLLGAFGWYGRTLGPPICRIRRPLVERARSRTISPSMRKRGPREYSALSGSTARLRGSMRADWR